MTIDEIRRQVLSLPLDQRALLAEQLLSSLDAPSETEIAELWPAEAKAERRAAEIDRGEVVLVSGEDLETQVQVLLR